MREMSLLLAGIALICLGACSPPADPLQFGQLCVQSNLASVPESCEPEKIITRDTTLGRNAIDYRITNPTQTPIRVQIEAGDLSFFQSGTSTGDRMPYQGNITSDDLVAFRERILAPGESLNDRLLPSELGREAELWFALYCEPVASCAATLDYVVIIDPLECQVKEDCSSGWECDIPRGTCVECIRGQNNCSAGQTCELGRCTPPRQSSCAHPHQSPRGSWWLLGMLALLMLAPLVKKKLKHTHTKKVLFLSCLLLGCLLPSVAMAQWQASFVLGPGSHHLTGELGEQTKRGVSFSMRQDVRWGILGLGLNLDYATFITTKPQDTPPFSNQLGINTVRIGPRLHTTKFLRRSVLFYADAQYARVGLSSNSLLNLTGGIQNNNTHGWSAGGGMRYQWNILVVDLGGQYTRMASLPGDSVSVTLMTGISTL